MILAGIPEWLEKLVSFYRGGIPRPKNRHRRLAMLSHMEPMEARILMFSASMAGPTVTMYEGTQYGFDLTADDTIGSFGVDFDDGSGTSTNPIIHTYADNGTYTVGAHVFSYPMLEETDTDPLNLTVNNIAPTVAAGDDAQINEGQSVNLEGSFVSDPGVNDTIGSPHWLITDSQSQTVVQANSYTLQFFPSAPGTYTAAFSLSDGTDTGYDDLTITVDAIAPAAPSGLSATATSAWQINLSWTDNAFNETSFIIERSEDGTTFDALDTVSANATGYQDVNLDPATIYYYRVKATNAVGDSDYTSIAYDTTEEDPTPAAPSGLTITSVTAESVNLAWTDNATNETGFRIERSRDGSSFSAIATVAANVTTFSDGDSHGLWAPGTYYFRVLAFNDDGPSAPTSSVNTPFTPVNSAYGGTAPLGPGLIEIENFDAGGDGHGYFDLDSTNQGGIFYRYGEEVDIDIARDDNGSYVVGWTKATEWIKYTINVPTAGTYDLSTSVSAPRSGGIFHWEMDGADITGSVAVPNTGGYYTYQLLTTTGLSLTAGNHVFKLCMDHEADGTGGGENTQYTSVANFNYFSLTDSAASLSAPTNLAAVSAFTTRVDLSWEDANVNESGFELQRSSDGGSTWSTAAILRADATTYADTGLTPGNSYRYRLRAVHGSASSSAWSDLTAPLTTPQASAYPLQINFQVDSGHPLPGHKIDTGQVYGSRGDGLSYGWSNSGQ